MDIETVLENFNNLIDKSYLGLWKRRFNSELEAENYRHFPIALLDITKIFMAIINQSAFDEEKKRLISDKLIDIKSLFFFLDNSTDRFYIGAFEIIGNGEFEKADEKTLSWLQLTHYKVYLISTLYEKTVDLFEIIFTGQLTDNKNDKIGKKLTKLWQLDNFDLVNQEEHQTLTKFRDTARRGEIHGTSSVLRQLFKDEWNHFSTEETAIKEIMKRFYIKYNNGSC